MWWSRSLSASKMPLCKRLNSDMNTGVSLLLREVCLGYQSELPSGTTSVVLKNPNHKIQVEAYDQTGKLIGIIPSEKTSSAFQHELTAIFGNVRSPDPDGIIAATLRLIQKRSAARLTPSPDGVCFRYSPWGGALRSRVPTSYPQEQVGRCASPPL